MVAASTANKLSLINESFDWANVCNLPGYSTINIFFIFHWRWIIHSDALTATSWHPDEKGKRNIIKQTENNVVYMDLTRKQTPFGRARLLAFHHIQANIVCSIEFVVMKSILLTSFCCLICFHTA